MLKESELKEKLKLLTVKQQLAIGIVLSYPMYEGYRIFNERYGFGNAHFLLNTLNELKQSFDKETLTLFDTEYLKKVEALTANSDDFETEWCTYSQGFSMSLYYLVESVINNQIDSIKHIVTRLTESIYFMLYDKYDGRFGRDYKKFLASINEDELMQHWLSAINNVILSIASLNAITAQDLDSIIIRLSKLPYENITEGE